MPKHCTMIIKLLCDVKLACDITCMLLWETKWCDWCCFGFLMACCNCVLTVCFVLFGYWVIQPMHHYGKASFGYGGILMMSFRLASSEWCHKVMYWTWWPSVFLLSPDQVYLTNILILITVVQVFVFLFYKFFLCTLCLSFLLICYYYHVKFLFYYATYLISEVLWARLICWLILFFQWNAVLYR